MQGRLVELEAVLNLGQSYSYCLRVRELASECST